MRRNKLINRAILPLSFKASSAVITIKEFSLAPLTLLLFSSVFKCLVITTYFLHLLLLWWPAKFYYLHSTVSKEGINECWKSKLFSFLHCYFAALDCIFCLRSRGSGGGGNTFIWTHMDTHICTSSHLFFLGLRQKHPSNQKADPFPSPCCSSFQCFSLLLLCEHMSVNTGWGFVVCCRKLPELVSEESK